MNTQENQLAAWPPTYQLKKHRRAKHVKLRVNRLHGLEITVPYRFNVREIPGILEEKKNWIIKQFEQYQANSIVTKPTEILLQAMNETWQVEYIHAEKRLSLTEHLFDQRIILMGHVDDEAKCLKLINAWLKRKAHIFLNALLCKLSQETTLQFAELTVRAQKTLWGSCTSQKKINLNYRLILLPYELARHVVLHELCHTKHLNHSKRFWALVAKHDEAWQTNNNALRRADDLLPAWCLTV